jgi:hypothetical protein
VGYPEEGGSARRLGRHKTCPYAPCQNSYQKNKNSRYCNAGLALQPCGTSTTLSPSARRGLEVGTLRPADSLDRLSCPKDFPFFGTDRTHGNESKSRRAGVRALRYLGPVPQKLVGVLCPPIFPLPPATRHYPLFTNHCLTHTSAPPWDRPWSPCGQEDSRPVVKCR